MKAERIDSTLSKEYICEALMLLLKEKPYREITVTDICRRAGVARITFYKHFRTRDSVARAMAEFCMNRCRAQVKEKADIKERIAAVFRFLIPLADSIRNLVKSDGMMQLYSSFRDFCRALFPSWEKFGYAGGLFMLTMEWLENERRATPEEMARSAMHILAPVPAI